MDVEKLRLAQTIDTWVQGIVRQSSSDNQADEQLLESMIDYMGPFKQLLDTCTKLEMNLLIHQYDGFYRFANLLERLAQAIQDGVIEVPEDAPMPPGWIAKSQRPSQKQPATSLRSVQALSGPTELGKSKGPRKPNPKRHQNKQQQIRRPISFLPTYTELIIGELAQTEEQYASFAAAGDRRAVAHKPHVLDDAIVDRAVKLYEDQLSFIPLHEQQLNWWLSENITDAQRSQVEDLLARLPALREKTEALLALLAELKQGTIDRILEMSDEELGWKFLRGELGDLG